MANCSLLKEAQSMEEKRSAEMGEERVRLQHSDDDDGADALEADERKLLSRYGIWLLVELTPPKEDIPIVRLMQAWMLHLLNLLQF